MADNRVSVNQESDLHVTGSWPHTLQAARHTTELTLITINQQMYGKKVKACSFNI